MMKPHDEIDQNLEMGHQRHDLNIQHHWNHNFGQVYEGVLKRVQN